MRSGFFSKYSRPLIVAASILVQAGIQVISKQGTEDSDSTPAKEKKVSGSFPFYQKKPLAVERKQAPQASCASAGTSVNSSLPLRK